VVVIFFLRHKDIDFAFAISFALHDFPPSGSPPQNRASLRTVYSTSVNDVPSSFFEDFKAFGFFFSLLDPENIYLLALLF